MKRVVLFVIVIVMILAGCEHKSLDENQNSSDRITEDPFQSKENSTEESATDTIGSISHGIAVSDNSKTTDGNILYNGGELELGYFVKAAGIANKCGFLVYINGIPQPYKIQKDDTVSDNGYMHQLELEDNEEFDFKFVFTPVTGKKGETLPVSIVSITDPLNQPNMKETIGYGYTHKILEYNFYIQYAAGTNGIEDMKSGFKNVLNGLSVTDTALTDSIKKQLNSGWILNNSDYEQNVYSKLYINDIDQTLEASYDIHGKEKIHVTFQLTGHPGIVYKNILYFNHMPLCSNKENSFQTELKKGKVAIVDMDLDVSKLNGNGSFYIVSVPCNTNDYPNDVITIKKTNSIFFYDKEELNNSSNPDKTQNSNTKVNSNQIQDVSQVKINEFNELIKDVEYAGNGNLLILADKLYLYSVSKEEVISTAEGEPGLDNFGVKILDNGYAVIGTTGAIKESSTNLFGASAKPEKSYNMACTFYGKNLNKISEIDIVKEIGVDAINPSDIAVSDDGKQIAGINLNGLYLYDRTTNTKKCIVDNTANQSSDIQNIIFTNIGFVNNNQISFLAQILRANANENETSYSAYGVVNVDGSKLISYRGEDLGKLLAYHNIALVSQDIAMNEPSGQADVFYCSSNKSIKFSLDEKSESEHIWGSENGKYFASSVLEDGKGWMIRIYSLETGEKVYQKLQNIKNMESYKDPYIYVMEKDKKYVLFFRSMSSTVKPDIMEAKF
jgi:hypothetical protein